MIAWSVAPGARRSPYGFGPAWLAKTHRGRSVSDGSLATRARSGNVPPWLVAFLADADRAQVRGRGPITSAPARRSRSCGSWPEFVAPRAAPQRRGDDRLSRRQEVPPLPSRASTWPVTFARKKGLWALPF